MTIVVDARWILFNLTSTTIKETCLSFVVCGLSLGSRCLSGHAALAGSDTNACTRTNYMHNRACMIYVDLYERARINNYNVIMWVKLATVAFKLKARVCAAVLLETYRHACPWVQKFTPRSKAILQNNLQRLQS